jgi:hypothetical protein
MGSAYFVSPPDSLIQLIRVAVVYHTAGKPPIALFKVLYTCHQHPTQKKVTSHESKIDSVGEFREVARKEYALFLKQKHV